MILKYTFLRLFYIIVFMKAFKAVALLKNATGTKFVKSSVAFLTKQSIIPASYFLMPT